MPTGYQPFCFTVATLELATGYKVEKVEKPYSLSTPNEINTHQDTINRMPVVFSGTRLLEEQISGREARREGTL